MRKEHSKVNKGKTKRFCFGDRIRDKITRIKKEYKYTVERSKEPTEEAKYIVVYESTTKHGFNAGRAFKGSYKECYKFIKEVENE